MMPLTVVCLLVAGEYPFTAEYVRRLLAMVTRWSDRPFRFVCLTDQPDAMPAGVEAVKVARLPGCFAYWTKLELFNPARRWSGRVLYLDLDTLIVAPLTPIVDSSAPFAATADPVVPRSNQKTTDSYGRAIVRKFNSSVMVWNAAATPTQLYTDWTPAVADRLSGDQDWLAEQLPEAHGLPLAWFPRLSQVGPPPFAESVKVILSKHPKNDVAVHRFSWFEPLWGAA
jgi:hypothetical protein